MLTETVVEKRCQLLGKYIVKTGATVRAAAAAFGISKSTVHKDITEKLERINPSLYRSVKEVLDKNKSERHIRGGEATKEKYKKLKLKNEKFTES
ncbi:MAG: sporulation transcriptional regulator SpoIIID [Clostridia bacterium]|nr:sporulation transcriptional regulator SpoIIID [Clostridia bacterium]